MKRFVKEIVKVSIMIVLALIIILSGCKKDKGGCWDCKDAQGVFLQTVCADSEKEAFNNSGIINGTHDINTFRTFCKKQ